MLWIVVSQACLSMDGNYRLTDSINHDIFGADGITWSRFFNERTPQSLYLVGDTVHLLWARVDNGNRYNRSDDRGTTWNWCTGLDCHGIQVLSRFWESSIVARDTMVYAISYCWDCSPSSHVPFNRSNDGGNTWSGDTVIFWAHEYGGGPRNLDSPAMDASPDGSVILLVVDAYDWGIRVKRSSDYGLTWEPPGGYVVATPSSRAERHPQISYNNAGRWFVCYTDFPHIMVTYSDDNGATWSTPVPLDTLTTNLTYNSCHVSASLNNVSVVWFDKKRNAINVYYRESEDGGLTWSPKENITGLISYSDTAAGATVINRQGVVYITWFEKSDRSGGNFEIMETCKPAPDSSWYPVQNISMTPGRSLWPMIAYNFVKGYGIACWQDNTPENYEIYCAAFRPLVGNDDLGVVENTSEREKVDVKVTGSTVLLNVPGEIYTPSGRVIFRGKGKVDLETGVYIVRIGKATRTVIVR